MDFQNKLPEWKNEGTEPPKNLKDEGFKAGYKPPAGIFNWFWSVVSRAISEIQGVLTRHDMDLQTKAETNLTNVTNEDFKAKADAAGAGGVPPEMAARLVYSGPAVPGTPIVIPQDADTLEHKTLAQILTDTALTGSPTAPTPAQGDSSALIATTAFVSAAIIRLIGSAPGALDTLEELAAALGNDANFAATVTNLIAGKAAQADLTAHIADAVKHITAAERAAWNAKASAPVIGTYGGTGAYGEASPVNLSLGFRPSMLFVQDCNSRWQGTTQLIALRDVSIVNTSLSGTQSYEVKLSWSETGVSWYNASNAGAQLNMSGQTYRYIAWR